MKKKATAKALLMSVLSMLLCLSMLIGTTFAWFTDSVTSGVNKIVAGNLDVEVKYNVLDENGELTDKWENLEDATSLFSENLWEPGHTEYAVLRIQNVGSLALKYQAKVDVVNETGSINVNGDQFKLSDYLLYGVDYSAIDADPSSLSRDEAVAKATDKLGAYDSGEGKILNPGEAKYMTLAITMPTETGNEANYKKGYNAPYIELGVSVLATQAVKENDSFGPDYDVNAKYPDPTFTSTNNVTFPVTATAALDEATGDYVAELEVKLVGEETPVNVGTVTVPAARVDENNLPIVNIDPVVNNEGNFTVADGKQAKFYDISVSNLKPEDGEVTVKMKLEAGLKNVVIKHKTATGVEDVPCDYNEDTGFVEFKTNSFSPFMFEYKAEKVATVSGVGYNTLKDAIAAAKAGDTITLLSDTSVKEALTISAGITIEGNGHTITDSTGALKPAINIDTDQAVTINNLTINGAERGIYLNKSAANLTLTDCTLNVSKIGVYCSLDNYDGMNLSLDGTKVNCTKVSDYETNTAIDSNCRGIELWGTKNTNVTLKNGSELNGFGYCINVGGVQSESGVIDTKGLIVTVEDSTLRGWTGFNVWGSEGTYNLIRSTVRGVNVSKGSSDSFAAIVFNDDLYGQLENFHAENNILNITDSTITNYQGGTCAEELLRIDCGITKLNLRGTVNFVDTTDNVSSALYLANMSDLVLFLQNSVDMEGAAVTCTAKDGSELPFAPSYTTYYYWPQGDGFRGVNCDLFDIFTSSDFNLCNGEFIDLLADATLNKDVTAELDVGVGSFTLKQGEYTVTGGKIILPAGVSVITDKENDTLFAAADGAELTKEVKDGKIIYSATALS